LKALVTGSGGLIGSQCARLLCKAGADVIGIDNDMRAQFFGHTATTAPVVRDLVREHERYRHHRADIRDRNAMREIVRDEKPDLIVHAAAQPSHDRAAAIPYDDFDVNAVGTLNLLVAAREHAPEAPFCFMSTNKVYGDRPNQLPLVEREKRWDYADGIDGIGEDMSIDQCLHSLFGASKTAADVLCQEYGRYFGMPIGIFRGGCLTGPDHAGVELHGYLNYIVRCAVLGIPYTIYGYGGKQVRDQIHAHDVVQLFLAFARDPRPGEVYNLGGGRANSISILETIDALAERGFTLQTQYCDTPRRGDHVCYISDLTKIRAHFPSWKLEYDVPRILHEIIERYHRR
jgi:CDP-paratose 2-epimerase